MPQPNSETMGISGSSHTGLGEYKGNVGIISHGPHTPPLEDEIRQAGKKTPGSFPPHTATPCHA